MDSKNIVMNSVIYSSLVLFYHKKKDGFAVCPRIIFFFGINHGHTKLGKSYRKNDNPVGI